MKAMVFAAGLGTRLRPFTNNQPKALVEIDGQALLAIVLRRLKHQGITEVVVNVHHYADQVIRFLEEADYFGLHLHISDERELLLETGGGLAKAAAHFQDGPFLVHNVDIMSDIDLQALRQAHQHAGALATLAVRQRESSRYLRFTEEGLLAGWRHARTGEVKVAREAADLQDLAFSGISIFDPRIFDFFPSDKQVFSIIEVLLAAARTEKVMGYRHDDTAWLDVGKPEAMAPAAALLQSLPLGAE